jgi:hypothetical protein
MKDALTPPSGGPEAFAGDCEKPIEVDSRTMLAILVALTTLAMTVILSALAPVRAHGPADNPGSERKRRTDDSG